MFFFNVTPFSTRFRASIAPAISLIAWARRVIWTTSVVCNKVWFNKFNFLVNVSTTELLLLLEMAWLNEAKGTGFEGMTKKQQQQKIVNVVCNWVCVLERFESFWGNYQNIGNP